MRCLARHAGARCREPGRPAARGDTSIALGNITGSNILNLTLILGVAALVAKVEVTLSGVTAGTTPSDRAPRPVALDSLRNHYHCH